ncbi:MAG: hypothetical protein AAF654_09305 [Myxococcota bacterium]
MDLGLEVDPARIALGTGESVALGLRAHVADGMRRSRVCLCVELLILAATALLANGCALWIGGLDSEFYPAEAGRRFQARDKQALRVLRSKDEVDRSTYALIGRVKAELRTAICEADVGRRGCSGTGLSASRALKEARERAAEAGGDLLVVTYEGEESKFRNQNGICLQWRDSTDGSGKPVRRCTRHEQVRIRDVYSVVRGRVYRADSILAQEMANRPGYDHEGDGGLERAEEIRRTDRELSRELLVASCENDGSELACAAAVVERKGATAADIATGLQALCDEGNLTGCTALFWPRLLPELISISSAYDSYFPSLPAKTRDGFLARTIEMCLPKASSSPEHATLCGAIYAAFRFSPNVQNASRLPYRAKWHATPLTVRQAENLALAGCFAPPSRQRTIVCLDGASLLHHRGQDPRPIVKRAVVEASLARGVISHASPCDAFEARYRAWVGCVADAQDAQAASVSARVMANFEQLRKSHAARLGVSADAPEVIFLAAQQIEETVERHRDWFTGVACKGGHLEACLTRMNVYPKYARSEDLVHACKLNHVASCETALDRVGKGFLPPTPGYEMNTLMAASERQCREKNRGICDRLARAYARSPLPDGRRLAEYRALACKNGVSKHCGSPPR